MRIVGSGFAEDRTAVELLEGPEPTFNGTSEPLPARTTDIIRLEGFCEQSKF